MLQFLTGDGESINFINGVTIAIKNTADNWDVVLFLIVSTLLVFILIIAVLYFIPKLFKFQAVMQHKARDEIRLKNRIKHLELIQRQQSIDLGHQQMDTQMKNEGTCEEIYDVVLSVHRSPLPPPPEDNDDFDDQMQDVEIDFSAIDNVPETFNMWDEPPTPIIPSDPQTNG